MYFTKIRTNIYVNSYYEVSILYAVRNADLLHNIYLDLS